MEDIQNIIAERDALKSENKSIKDVLERVACEKIAWEQTAAEVLHANISLKAGAHLLEKKISSMQDEIAKKDVELSDLKAQLSKLSLVEQEAA